MIEFDRGGDHGTAAYTLTTGRYKFVSTPQGWDLVLTNDRPGPDRSNPAVPQTATRPDPNQPGDYR